MHILMWLFVQLFGMIAEQRSTVAGVAACVILIVTLVFCYWFGAWWLWGIVPATICGLIAMFSVMKE